MMSLIARIKPNIFFAILAITALGLLVSFMGFKMDQEGIITGAGIGSIVAIANLATKILDGEG
jgi:uncharacterized membrane protein